MLFKCACIMVERPSPPHRCLAWTTLAFLALSQAAGAEELGRFQLDGRTIVIDSDGTWTYADDRAPAGSAEGCQVLAVPPIRFCLPEGEWEPAELGGEFAFGFASKSHELHLGIIAEDTFFAFDTMPDLIRENAGAAAADDDAARVDGETAGADEVLSISGERWGIVRFKLDLDGVPFRFETYFAAVEGEGTAQFVFWAPEDIFPTTAESRRRVAKSFDVVR